MKSELTSMLDSKKEGNTGEVPTEDRLEMKSKTTEGNKRYFIL